MIQKRGKRLLASIGGVALLACAVSFGAGVSFALYGQKATINADPYDGLVALRSYFQRGLGTSEDPFVISRPIHLYNLSRLQNLGALEGNYFFRVGWDGDNDPSNDAENPLYVFGTDTGNELNQTELDMSNYDGQLVDGVQHNSISPIGNEADPFTGEFDGSGLCVSHLTVEAGPEDAGLFGYIAPGGGVSNLALNDITIRDSGWMKNLPSGGSILVDTLSTISGGSLRYDGAVLYPEEASSAVANKNDAFITAGYNGTINLTAPSSENPNILFDFSCSSEFFTRTNVTGTTATFSANRGEDDPASDYYCIENLESFRTVTGATLTSRFSIVARYTENYITYSHVVSSYRALFVNDASGTIKLQIIEDSNETESLSAYSHGTNIGFVAGHCDGTLKNVYVKDGALVMNDGANDQYKMLAQESETGLIGEMSPSIDKTGTPGWGLSNNDGDTGIVNFTNIYEDVVGDSEFTEQDGYYSYVPNGYDSPSDLGSPDGPFANYDPFLRTNGGNNYADRQYATSRPNTFSWGGQKLVQDSDDANLGLGIFSISTSNRLANSNTTFKNGIDDSVVAANTESHPRVESSEISSEVRFSEIFYTTSELDESSSDSVSNFKNWKYGSLDNDYNISEGVVLPSYSGDGSEDSVNENGNVTMTWNPSLERHTNFIFRFDLADDTAMGGNNYLCNPRQTPFLENYFKYKLIDNDGNPLDPMITDYQVNANFGLFIKDKVKKANVEDLYCSLMLNAPEDGITLTTYNNSTDYETALPKNGINFKVSNANGANVTVVAASDEETGGYLSIYEKDKAWNDAGYFDARKPSYTTYIPSAANLDGYDRDNFCYFDTTYANYEENGITLAETLVEKTARRVSDEKATAPKLFAHTFKLKGPEEGEGEKEYFIASPQGNTKIYYVCAQGQSAGDVTMDSSVFSEINVIKNVDFVKSIPVIATQESPAGEDTGAFAASSLAEARLRMSFQADFDATAGSLYVKTSDATMPLLTGSANASISVDGSEPSGYRWSNGAPPSNLLYMIIQHENYTEPYLFNDAVQKGSLFVVYDNREEVGG